jgi:hypothetical protein
MKARDVENAERLFHRIPRDGAVLLPLVRSIDRDGVSVGPGHGGWLCALPGRRLCCAARQGGVALGSMLCASGGERPIG